MAIKETTPLSLKMPPSFIFWIAAGFIALITGIFVFISNNATYPPDVTPPLVEPQPIQEEVAPPPADCAGLNTTETETCCQAWALENEVVIPLCTGGWTFENNTCSYSCGVNQ